MLWARDGRSGASNPDDPACPRRRQLSPKAAMADPFLDSPADVCVDKQFPIGPARLQLIALGIAANRSGAAMHPGHWPFGRWP
jgi:hypothetical protein